MKHVVEGRVVMAQVHSLVAQVGEYAGERFEIRRRTVIGRGGDTDIQLLDGSVSRHHVLLVTCEDGSILLRDLSSANGTWVDGERVRQVKLRPGDRIAVGRTLFVYERTLSSQPTEAALKVLGGRAEASTFQASLGLEQMQLLARLTPRGLAGNGERH